ncbi:MAG: AbrB/MazE/SpoVT family DNA-binding domain-containing protein [Patescibacteria group bacterium]
MLKRLIQHGNSAALIIDKPILDLLRIKPETPVEVITDGRNIILSPLPGTEISEEDIARSLERVNKRHGATLRRLGQ